MDSTNDPKVKQSLKKWKDYSDKEKWSVLVIIYLAIGVPVFALLSHLPLLGWLMNFTIVGNVFLVFLLFGSIANADNMKKKYKNKDPELYMEGDKRKYTAIVLKTLVIFFGALLCAFGHWITFTIYFAIGLDFLGILLRGSPFGIEDYN